MKLFESNTAVLRRSAPARAGRRFVCWVTDMVLAVLLAQLLFLGVLPPVQRSGRYQAAEQTVAEEIAHYEQMTAQSHIVEYAEGRRVDTDVVVLKNLCRAICLSYEVYGNAQSPDFCITPGHDVTANGIQSTENDPVAYFYTHYLKENPQITAPAGGDLFALYRRAFGQDAAFFFTFDRAQSPIPVLNTQVAYYLFHFLFVDETDTVGQTGATYYRAYCNAYANMLEEAEMLLLQSEPYYSTHYAAYRQAYCAQARYTNMTLVLAVFAACFAVLFVPRCLFRDGRTIGYRLFGLGVVGTDGGASPWYVSALKSLIGAVGAIPLTFIMYLLPPFSGRFEAMFVPVSPASKLSLGLVILVITLLGGGANAVGLFTGRRQNLWNLIFDDLVVDTRDTRADAPEEVNHGRPY